MISVVIASFNGEAYIIRQLESIKNQTARVDEVIICDDGSSDKTVSLVENFISENNLAGWRVVQNVVILGYSLNFFKALSLAEGDIIFLADQDDLWYQSKVEVLKGYLDNNPDCLAVSSRYNIIGTFDEPIDNPGIRFAMQIDDGSVYEVNAESQIGSSNIRGCAMCIRRKLLSYIKPQKLDWLLGHDWLLNMAACLKGKNAVVNKILFGYRYHGGNSSLSAIERKELVGDYDKRISGLKQSVKVYGELLENENFADMPSCIKKEIEKQIKFEKRRLKFLRNKNLFLFFLLGFSFSRYGRLYGSKKSGIRIWLGDLAYAYHR